MHNDMHPSLCGNGGQSLQSCSTLCDPMDHSLQDSSVHWIFPAGILEWVAMPSSRGSSQPRDWTHISFIAGRFFTAEPLRKPFHHCSIIQNIFTAPTPFVLHLFIPSPPRSNKLWSSYCLHNLTFSRTSYSWNYTVLNFSNYPHSLGNMQLRFLHVLSWIGSSFLIQFSSIQSLSRVRLFATPWIAARQASLSITISRSSLRLTSIESVMPSSHLILCHPLLLLPPIPPSIRVFSNESTLCMRWPKSWSFSFSIIPSKEIPGLISFRMD